MIINDPKKITVNDGLAKMLRASELLSPTEIERLAEEAKKQAETTRQRGKGKEQR
ncbi:hypothetical protein RCO07_01880 [Escherichia marmotae]|nr:hypothetical protein [Escherichia marmotae]